MKKPQPQQAHADVTLNADAIRAQLARIEGDPLLGQARRLKALLRYLVEETLAGQGDRLKAYTVGLEVFAKPDSFDPQSDPIVRVQASRLRQLLEKYYAGPGCRDPLLIELVRGSYKPRFHPRTRRDAGVATELEPPLLAVAPLRCLGSDPAQRLFCQGLNDEFITRLSDYDSLRVLAGPVVRSHLKRHANPRRLHQDLGVTYLLEGSVQQDGNGLWVNLRLNDLSSATQCWGQRYEHPPVAPARMLAAQADIAARAVAVLAGPYGVIYRLQRCRAGTDHYPYSAVLRFQRYIEIRDAATHREAREALEAALDVAPEHADAWAALAAIHVGEAIYGFNPRPEPTPALARAQAAAYRALALAPLHSGGQRALTMVLFYQGEMAAFFSATERLLETLPRRVEILVHCGHYLALAGQWARGRALLEEAVGLNPLLPTWYHLSFALDHYRRGEHRAALEQARQLNMPGFFWDAIIEAVTAAAAGEARAAEQARQRLRHLSPWAWQHIHTVVHGLIKEPALAERCLRDLGVQRVPSLVLAGA